MNANSSKTVALLKFLHDTASLHRKRIRDYHEKDAKLLWFADLPRDLPPTWKDGCRSAFVEDNPAEIPDQDLWLEVRKKRKPRPPELPMLLRDWVPQKFQDHPEDYLDKNPEDLCNLLNPEITDLVERPVPDPHAPIGKGRRLTERIPEVRRLKDYPQVEDAWLDYLLNQWDPWKKEMHWWKQVQDVYETVDFMRRRLEEAEERYELFLGVGLLQWRDSTGNILKRHLLTAPAEISLDAARGILTVVPAASFEKFRVELDMLERQDQPQLEGTDLEKRLEELDVRAWDRAKVAEILRIIANKASSNAQVSEDIWKPLERTDETFRVVYAPALVLRERRLTSYEELINSFLKASEDPSTFSTTAPWERFVNEGEPSSSPAVKGPEADFSFNNAGSRIYFPLRTNNEQKSIVERLRKHPYVLVKGPPGTGKSETIANLICHLLATGERVLVTAHAPKALTVLLDRLPSNIRQLCVTALGSTHDDYKLLEESIQGILSRKNEWPEAKWVQDKVDQLEKELREIEDEVAKVDRQLLECREAETHSHTLIGGYEGTAAQIARRVEKERKAYDWFPELRDDQNSCPLRPQDIEFLADVHSALTDDHLNELCLEIGTLSLPGSDEFAQTIEKLSAAEHVAKTTRPGLHEEYLSILRQFSEAELDACRKFLNQLEEHVTQAESVLGELTREILKDLLFGRDARWERLKQEVKELVEQMHAARERAGTLQIDIPSNVETGKLLADTWRRFEYFRNGGWRGWGPFTPRIVRETRYIEERCRVKGEVARDQKSLEMLLGFLELKALLQRFQTVWPRPEAIPHCDPRHAVDKVADLGQELSRLLESFKSADRKTLDVVPIEKRATLAEPDERTRWRHSIEAELAFRRMQQARAPLEAWYAAIRGLVHVTVHPCIVELAKAIEDRDSARWSAAWHTRERLIKARDRFRNYQVLLDKIRGVSPELVNLLQSTQGNPEWKDRLRQLEQAWAWASARAWLSKVTDPGCYKRLSEKRDQLQSRMKKKLNELVDLKAWQAFFQRLDDRTEQNLIAWKNAFRRIGKGTGKYAHRHRETARRYLMDCIPKMPAWIMPLHKLWETTDPTPGVFDTVIVDEASQAGIEALVLLLLAKRIIVVGDDKQNSPEAVGVSEDDIARSARNHLHEFRFREEFRPDTSLYDHAERAFGNPISLREHFRCVPEIIRFSNELCYTDAPLIPLRQPPPERLRPLEVIFVGEGHCEGEGQRITNHPEAEAIVKKIQECIEDEAYKAKTMGVIVLQGHAQAELIEKKLAEVLEPRVREERKLKLRCGVPATFQGDERDVIFLSLVVAPNHQFRALTEPEAQRRFNVAMSRARDQVWLFHSVKQHDLSTQDLRWRLLDFFYKPVPHDDVYKELDRLEREAQRRSREPNSQPDPYESWFEVDVALELLRRNYRVRPEYEVAGYRIDLVVEGLSNRLAVECDGEAWHGPDRFKQDMDRQRQLERAGWTFVRIRESEFYADRKSAIQRIVEACKELKIGEEQR
ncbi:DUF559 domain-containing protein [Candidatus Methylacidiphilum infernorum]|uniref:DUF559 domain-containing protein n=1 Tax=Candidatus Methylacidiphilum infernorum TaxID=511746 RepID=A0ABX7PTQ5_9BACT|nr:AAA domain-containing protein [Candidatus Methylacidiphilum infernorum]QSR86098.1 DUF559 domain-containing protein [Candidatus Methylacidiphilum infernorum]